MNRPSQPPAGGSEQAMDRRWLRAASWYVTVSRAPTEEQQAFLMEKGVPAHRIIIGHSCGSSDHDYHMRLLDKGSYLGFDRFGLDILAPDEQRIDALVARGVSREQIDTMLVDNPRRFFQGVT